MVPATSETATAGPTVLDNFMGGTPSAARALLGGSAQWHARRLAVVCSGTHSFVPSPGSSYAGHAPAVAGPRPAPEGPLLAGRSRYHVTSVSPPSPCSVTHNPTDRSGAFLI